MGKGATLSIEEKISRMSDEPKLTLKAIGGFNYIYAWDPTTYNIKETAKRRQLKKDKGYSTTSYGPVFDKWFNIGPLGSLEAKAILSERYGVSKAEAIHKELEDRRIEKLMRDGLNLEQAHDELDKELSFEAIVNKMILSRDITRRKAARELNKTLSEKK